MRYGKNIRFYEISSSEAELMLKVLRAVDHISGEYLPDMEIFGIIGEVSVYEFTEQQDGTWKWSMNIVNKKALPTKEEREEIEFVFGKTSFGRVCIGDV